MVLTDISELPRLYVQYCTRYNETSTQPCRKRDSSPLTRMVSGRRNPGVIRVSEIFLYFTFQFTNGVYFKSFVTRFQLTMFAKLKCICTVNSLHVCVQDSITGLVIDDFIMTIMIGANKERSSSGLILAVTDVSMINLTFVLGWVRLFRLLDFLIVSSHHWHLIIIYFM